MSQNSKPKLLDSMILKGIIIAVLTILMIIPITLVTSLIEERTVNKGLVTEDISSRWGGQQTLVSPILVVPYGNTANTNADGVFYKAGWGNTFFLPDVLNVDSEVKVEERWRGIYNTLVYQSENKISGSFSFPDLRSLKVHEDKAKWNEAYVLIGIPHMQGIKNKINFVANGKTYEAMPGVAKNSIVQSGLTIKLPLDSFPKGEKINFEFRVDLNGSEKLLIAPMGKENNIKMKSDWRVVSFTGDFLPKRKIDDNGFNAEWNIFDYNRNYEQMWEGDNNSTIPEVGVELKYTVDQYQMSMRSVKYAILFIALTFVIFLLVEIITKKKIHPVQYTLVSFALILFYTLLIALSEHINFHIAYLISAIAIVLMITLYVRTFFDKLSHTLAMGAFVAIIYIYLYVILQLEDMSLLIGAIGLFVALGAIMYFSRKVDWYKKSEERTNDDIQEY